MIESLSGWTLRARRAASTCSSCNSPAAGPPWRRLLAAVDSRPGLEPVVEMTSSAAVYRPGRVFTLSQGNLVQWGIETFTRGGTTYVAGSDMDSGLWVLKQTP